ncbi:hypothetical protein DFQ28_002133 [Apophysomyces sp. BC1034]|nr:hypothetical protein DFQ30_002536 [Apophysomyces sp. BC1015]KAG0179820.1 hypothetical protein DFQ29_001629 [Apophysomyces sp. BC1021]KAG0190389.1 hypothetical protein DFQ28_002133 [Apophysomyces sp. BC1034]
MVSTLLLLCISSIAAVVHASITGPIKHGDCVFSYNDTWYMYGRFPSAVKTSLYALDFPISNREDILRWRDLHGENNFTPEGCGVTDDGRVIMVSHELSVWMYNIGQRNWMQVPVQAPSNKKNHILSAMFRNIFVVFDTASRETYVLDVHSPPPWTWSIVQPTNTTPPTTDSMVAAGPHIYHIYNSHRDNQYANHIHAFDPVSKQWIGYVGSFLGPSNVSVTNYADQIFIIPTSDSLPVQPKEAPKLFWTLTMQSSPAAIRQLFVKRLGSSLQLPSANSTATAVNNHAILLYDSPSHGSSSFLTLYDPEKNIQSVRYAISRQEPPPFWETDEGRHTRVGLICALTIPLGLLAVLSLTILRRRRKVRARQAEKLPFEDASKRSKDVELLDEKSVEDAETWSRRVLRILSGIAHPPKNASRASSCSDLLSPKKKPTTVPAPHVSSRLREVSSSSSVGLQQQQQPWPREPVPVKTRDESMGLIRHALHLGSGNPR